MSTAEKRPSGQATPPPKDDDEDERDRVPLRSLAPISAPHDLAQTVPALINRRSRGRFFGRKRLSDRLPLEWLSLGMLVLLAIIYAALKLFLPT